MKFKNLGALFLLSLVSIYFICPVQCAAIQGAGENTISDRASSHYQHWIASQTVDETHQSICCQSENEPSAAHDRQEDKEGHCCFSQWDSLGASEPQPVSQIQNEIFSYIVLIPTTPRISSDFLSFAVYLQLPHKPSTDPSIAEFSPRAPPFFLA